MTTPTSTRIGAFWTAWSGFLCAHLRVVLFAGLALAAMGIGLMITRLEFQPNRNTLISPNLDWNRRFIHWRDRFPGARDLVVVIDAGANGHNREPAEEFARQLTERLEESPSVERVEWGAPQEEFSAKAARLLPADEFESLLGSIGESETLITSLTLPELVGGIANRLLQRQGTFQDDPNEAARALGELEELMLAMNADISGDEQGAMRAWIRGRAALTQPSNGRIRPLMSPNGRFILMRVTPKTTGTGLNELRPVLDLTRREIESVRARVTGVRAGVTGIEAVEADETRAAMIDSTLASMLALGLIALILISAFHSVRTPLLIVVALLVGVAWSFGYLTLVVGHLQILSMVFVVILLGLGVDFGIHLASTFESVRHEHPEESFTEALAEALSMIGPGVITGAVTTAAAFFVTATTQFRGVAEMGLIAGGGILLCLASMLTILPALKRRFSSSREHIRPLSDRRLHVYEERWSMPFVRAPRLTVIATLILLGAGAWSASKIRFDYDLPSLLPPRMPSVEWQDALIEEGGLSIWSATSIATTLDEARVLRRAFLKLPTVANVGGIGVLLPDDEPRKLELIESARSALSERARAAIEDPEQLPAVDPSPQVLINQIVLLRTGIDQALRRRDLPQAVRTRLNGISQALSDQLDMLGPLTPREARRRLSRAERSYREARREIVSMIRDALDPSPLDEHDLPEAFLRSYVASDGSGYALTINPRLPEDGSITSPLDPEFLPEFIDELERIDRDVTGVVVQFRKSGELIKQSFIWAGTVALLVVFLIVLLAFGRLADALLSLTPVVIAFVLTFGTVRLMGINVNPANIVVLPLLFGIGIDAGVHILHRFQENPELRPRGLTGGTGKGITVTSLTTIAGFASMMIAQHRGIYSLGLVLSVGITITMLASWIVLPALLEFRAGQPATPDAGSSPDRSRPEPGS